MCGLCDERGEWLVDFFFFFQAEDGIRDRDVTGVQTCALPISGTGPRSAVVGSIALPLCVSSPRASRRVRIRQASRSEERRVGKECRSRWSPDHQKKKNQKEWNL